jgi:tRNA dimethylallyltransferase
MGKNKLVVILGPTSSGKSDLGIKLAKKFNGEIISADSRQVYKGMDLGSGKVTKAEQRMVPHHLIDVASPKTQFTVSDFKRLYQKANSDIVGRGKIPFLVGGTAFYVYAAIDDWQIPEAPPNPALRKTLEKKTLKELQTILKNLDPKRYKTVDRQNRARLIRAIEINIATGKNVPKFSRSRIRTNKRMLILGVKKDKKQLDELIKKRLKQRLNAGMVKEAKRLLKSGVSHKKLRQFGLEYRFLSRYLNQEMDFDEMVRQLTVSIRQFSRRQMTWFKKDKRIVWVKNLKEAERAVKRWIGYKIKRNQISNPYKK